MHPPPPQRAYRCEQYGDYIFAVSRLAPLKRFSLLIEALAHPDAQGIRCVIAGEGEERPVLEHAIATRGLGSRVTLIGRIADSQLVEHLARCRTVCFPPYDEDYGFVTAEAFASSKPVITCVDSGGPAELVRDGVNGWVVAPRPDAMAGALRDAMHNLPLVERFGRAGLEQASHMTWERAVRRLLAP
jgi:glycosyltransferase involved in cell wall biosynthesis